MGIQINGQTDSISAVDGSISIQGGDLGSASASSLNITGIVTATTLRATNIVGVVTAGITTAYVTSINDGPLSGARNRIINGDCRIDQRYNGAATANTISGYTIDRWVLYQSVTGKLIAQQNAGSVTPPVGFTSYLGVTSQSAYSILSTDQYLIQQYIEGLNCSDLSWGTVSASPVTISFWVRSSLTGTFGGALRNNAGTRCYPFSFIINAANTWEYKTLTIPGDTTGTWLTNNGVGIVLSFNLGSGSTYSATAGSWTSSLYVSAPTGATSVVGTNGATFYITGIQLESGTVASAFERRSYGQELALCLRYYFAQTGLFVDTVGASYNTLSTIRYAHHIHGAPLLVPMRTSSPVLTYSMIMNGVTNVTSSYEATVNNGYCIRWRNSFSSYATQGDLFLSYTLSAEL